MIGPFSLGHIEWVLYLFVHEIGTANLGQSGYEVWMDEWMR